MEIIENNVKLILQGTAIEEAQEYCDFTLEEQNEASVAKGSAPSAPTEFRPVLRENVCYIVAAVLVDATGAVLMMQEAKSSCAGQWYLPAGRMEQGETIVEAAKREVLEETGLAIEVTTLLMVETASGSWFRFVVTGTVIGGELKTPARADSESLQAKWIFDMNELNLRGNDIYPLIQKARQYSLKRDEPWHPHLLPINLPHSKLLLRLIIVIRKKANNRMCVLVSDKTASHLPVTEINPVRSIHSILRKYMTEIFGSDLPPHRPQGVLSLELKTLIPKGELDGMCISLLVPVKKALEEVPLIDKYSWIELSKATGDAILNRLGKNMVIPLNVIR